jgi:hypothetical protein
MRALVGTSALNSFMAAAESVATGTMDPLTAWALYEQRHPDLFERYFDGWGDVDQRPVAASRMVETAERLHASGSYWQDLFADAGARITALTDGDYEVPVVVFVGVGTSNGWVTHLDGRATVFIAAELSAQPTFDRVLIAHELTHAAQHASDPEWEASDYPIGALVFAEGLGTLVSQYAYSGHRDDEYLWLDSTHQQWLQECEQAWPTAAPALHAVLDEPCGGATEQHFFSNRATGDPELPTRFGYYAGLRIVRETAIASTVADMLTLDVATAHLRVRNLLGDIATDN